MPTVIKEFTYTGTKQEAIVPAGAVSVEFHIWGGGGGGTVVQQMGTATWRARVHFAPGAVSLKGT